MSYLEMLEKNRKEGWVMYCGICDKYIKQSDPQNFSGGKTIVISSEGAECENCIKDAQETMGRLGVAEPKPLEPKHD